MKMVEQQAAFLRDLRKLYAFAEGLDYVITLGEAERPLMVQKYYVQTGRSKTLKSMHLVRMAQDLNIFKDGRLCGREEIRPLGEYWEGLNTLNRWGGSWRGLVDSGRSSFIDAPHFERRLV